MVIASHTFVLAIRDKLFGFSKEFILAHSVAIAKILIQF